MASPTDTARWQATARATPSWIGRNEVLARWIPPGSSVLDVGAGSMNLRDVLPHGCRYQPADVVISSDRTRLVDFNAWTVPEFDEQFDVVVCSGVLEYLVDVNFALRSLAAWGRRVVMSYAPATVPPDVDARRRSGWVNHLTEAALLDAIARSGLEVARRDRWQAQSLFLLEPAHRLPASTELAAGKARARWPVSLFRADPTNVGDWFSAPARHLPALAGAEIDIFSIQAPTRVDAPVIVGGGGLFAPVFDRRFDAVRFSDRHPVVAWGLGENTRIDTEAGWVDDGPLVTPAWASRADLMGVRDYGSDHLWAPCASCLHSSFLEPRTATHEVVIFAHKRIPIEADGLPTRTNEGCDLEATLDFLASGHVVVTNSYHGAYWATLLGRAVVAMPFSSKFWGLRHRPVFSKPSGWRRALEFARPYPTALVDCRAATREFAEKAGRLLGIETGFAVGCRPRPTHPIDVRMPGAASRACTAAGSMAERLEALGLGPEQRTRVARELAGRGPVQFVQEAGDLPPADRAWRAVVVAPGALPDVEALFERVSSTGQVVLVGSQAEAHDRLKLRLRETRHIGVETDGGMDVWIGTREDARPGSGAGPLPCVVCYYTVGTPYEAEAARLRASCQRLGVPHDIRALPARGSWEANCAQKAGFIRQVWQQRREPVLWVDADACLHAPPDLLRGEHADFAVHKVDGWQFASGTIFFNSTPPAGELLSVWERLCLEHPHVFDQVLLDIAWEDVARRMPLETRWLPAGYTLIFDRSEALGGAVRPVIVHHQASRRLKGAVSSTVAARSAAEMSADWQRARRASRFWCFGPGAADRRRVLDGGAPEAVPGSSAELPAAFLAYEARVSEWIDRHRADAGRVAIHGASWFGVRLCARFRRAGVEPVCFLDNDGTRHDQDLVGLPIAPPAPQLTSQLDTVVIASIAHGAEIEAGLRASGLRRPAILAAHHAEDEHQRRTTSS